MLKIEEGGEKIKKSYKFIENVFYGVLIILAISYLVSCYKVYKGEKIIPNILGYYGFTIMTGSMEPTISSGDFLISKNVNGKDITIGDIITFIDEDSIITHRVSRILENEDFDKVFITKGDANNVEDDNLVNTKDVFSKYMVSIPILGYLLNYIKNIDGLILIGIFILLCSSLIILKIQINKKGSGNYE